MRVLGILSFYVFYLAYPEIFLVTFYLLYPSLRISPLPLSLTFSPLLSSYQSLLGFWWLLFFLLGLCFAVF